MNAAVLAAVTGVLGIILGRFWDGRSEALRWRRDQKTASYQRLAEAFSKVYEHIRAVALAGPDTSALIDAVDRARQDKTWDNALAAVWLHGSAAVVDASSSLDLEVTKLFHEVESQHLSVADWNRARTPSTQALLRFIDAARDELRLPSVAIQPVPHAAH